MKGLVYSLVLALCGLAAVPAQANVAPPRVIWPARVVPDALKAWFDAAGLAMISRDMQAAETLCAKRGFETNLIGKGGSSMKELFERGASEGFRMVADYTRTWEVFDRFGFIVRAELRDNSRHRVLAVVYVLIESERDLDNVITWRAVGVGDHISRVEYLARREARYPYRDRPRDRLE